MDQHTVIAYALGILPEHEMHIVEQDLKRYPQYARELKRYLNVLATMVMSEEAIEIPQNANYQLLENIIQSKQSLSN